MKVKKLMISALAIALLTGPAMNPDIAHAKEEKITQGVKTKELSKKGAVQLASKLAHVTSAVQSGGLYQEGEYKTFIYQRKTYRYLAKDIDTKKELLSFLKTALTHTAAEQFIKKQGIIEHKGKMAQLEADGGSLLQWGEATAEFLKDNGKTKYYRLSVPVGDTGTSEAYIVEFQHVKKVGWRISKKPYLDLDIPFNVNPALIFFNNLVKNLDLAKSQLIDSKTFSYDLLKKGVKKVELVELKELKRNQTQVEYVAKVDVELENSYQGSLKEGINQFYILIQPVDDMEFKIVSLGNTPQLNK
ncbi:DL-endopeptidase inhibitor IseA family protein [Ureibacillus sinduriensis]|uniref:DL-endopeptidase inhibitor IseA family protein n=1 Tax=Ureibacillus sinduriensis TaxID=561440 RepID=UPI000689338C|nr:DL-endopeptidase inhibitor IseA family protein [Ureibacillus sinduriensis]